MYGTVLGLHYDTVFQDHSHDAKEEQTERERESYFKHSRYTHEQTHTVDWLAHGMRSISCGGGGGWSATDTEEAAAPALASNLLEDSG